MSFGNGTGRNHLQGSRTTSGSDSGADRRGGAARATHRRGVTMPLRETAPVGAPCWIDLMTSDPDKSRAFYTELFGWKAEEPNPDFGGYWNFSKDDVLVAGGMQNQGGGAPDGWSVYLATTDADATVAA